MHVLVSSTRIYKSWSEYLNSFKTTRSRSIMRVECEHVRVEYKLKGEAHEVTHNHRAGILTDNTNWWSTNSAKIVIVLFSRVSRVWQWCSDVSMPVP